MNYRRCAPTLYLIVVIFPATGIIPTAGTVPVTKAGSLICMFDRTEGFVCGEYTDLRTLIIEDGSSRMLSIFETGNIPYFHDSVTKRLLQSWRECSTMDIPVYQQVEGGFNRCLTWTIRPFTIDEISTYSNSGSMASIVPSLSSTGTISNSIRSDHLATHS